MASTDAKPIPEKNANFRHYFCIRKKDGTLVTGWTGADSEFSLNGTTFTDCSNEATEIDTSGCGYIDLIASEMDSDATVLRVTVTNTDALTYVVTFFPRESGDIKTTVEDKTGFALTTAAYSAVWDADLSGVRPAASAGDRMKLVYADTNELQINQTAWTAVAARTEMDANSTKLADIVADTNELQSNYTNWNTLDPIAVWDVQTSVIDNVGSIGVTLLNNFGDVAAILADTNELQTNQNNWLTLDPLTVWDVQTSIINDVGSIGVSTLGTFASIGFILADTNELQTNQGDWVALDPLEVWNVPTANIIVADSIGLATLGAHQDITDILADTNELQTNQGDWATATGFSTHSPSAIWDVSLAAVRPTDSAGEKLKLVEGKTSQLTFTIANQVDANALTGGGSGGDGSSLTNIPWNPAWDAEVESEVSDALVGLHLDHLFAVDYDATSPPGVATALLNELVEDFVGESRFTANALSQASGSGATAEQVRIEMDTFSTKLADIVNDTNELQMNQFSLSDFWDIDLSGPRPEGSAGDKLKEVHAKRLGYAF